MRPHFVLLVAALAAPLLAGCLKEPEVREVAGPTDGYSPTASYLKVHVLREDGTRVLVDFDRRDWHVSEIARRLDDRRIDFLTVQAKQRDLIGEVLVESVLKPEDLASLYYPTMDATPEQRAEMDREYDAILERAMAGVAVPTPAPPGPKVPLPSVG